MSEPIESRDFIYAMKEMGVEKWRVRVLHTIIGNGKVIESQEITLYVYGSMQDAKSLAKTITEGLCASSQMHHGVEAFISKYTESAHGLTAVKEYFSIRWTETRGWKSLFSLTYDSKEGILQERPYELEVSQNAYSHRFA